MRQTEVFFSWQGELKDITVEIESGQVAKFEI